MRLKEISRMKSGLRRTAYFLAFLFLVFGRASFATPEGSRTLFVDMPQGSGPSDAPACTLIVSAVDTPQEERNVVAAAAAHPDEAALLVSGPQDPVHRNPVAAEATMFAADSAKDVPLLQESRFQKYIEMIRTRVKEHKNHIRSQPLGFVIAAACGAGYSSAFFYGTQSYLAASSMGSVAFIVNLILFAYSHEWVDFSKKIGGKFNAGVMALASALGKPFGDKTQVRIRRFGQVFPAVGLNFLVATLASSFLGPISADDFAKNLLLAFFLSHEIIDYKVHQEMKAKNIPFAVATRILVFLGIDIAVLNHSEVAHMIAGFAVTTFMISFIFQEPINQKLKSLQNFALENWLRLKETGSKVRRLPARALAALNRKLKAGEDPLSPETERSTDCESLLTHLHFHPF